MPAIHVDLSNAQGYESLPEGEYLAQIDGLVHKPTDDPDKFDQIMVKYQVIDGELLGKTATEWLSLSPKAAFRLAKWFGKFGIELEEDTLESDDDTLDITNPDLVGLQVIIRSFKERDKRKPATDPDAYRIRIALVSVEDEVDSAPAPKSTKRVEQEAEADDTADEDDDGEEEAPKRVARPVKPAARPAKRTLR